MTSKLSNILAAATALAVLSAAPSLAQQSGDVAGSYLAGRHAQSHSDFDSAATYFTRAMTRDQANPALIEAALTSFVGLGQLDRAATIATQMIATGADSQVANLVLLSRDAKNGDWSDLLNNMEAGQSVGQLFDGLVRAWALVGAGRAEDALAAFDSVTTSKGVEAFGLYHKALALASMGRFDEAETVLSGEAQLQLARRGLVAQAQILSQLDRNDEALTRLRAGFGAEMDPVLTAMIERLEAGETLEFTIAPDARAGVAEVIFSIANALSVETAENYTLLYSRMAQYLRPDHIEAILLSAGLLDRLEQYDLAIGAFREVPRDHPAFDAAELGRADVLRRSGKEDAAIEVFQQLAKLRPDMALIQVTIGDTFRELDRHQDALAAYDRAVELFTQDAPGQWVVYFARGISRERTGDWEGSEADFNKALELQPEQPQVLNYLGYSYVERQENLPRALDMIERAVAAMPDSGYIADSLGWVYYRLGRYQEAVAPMEKAVELMPVDPVVNDHLGDVYWAVGRKLEARFQWKRALSFAENDENDEIKPDRIRAKLEVGLDLVLEDEGAAPLKVADEG